MPIVPETRDWTFVLREVCPECNFDSHGFRREAVGDLIRANAWLWPVLLAHPDAARRPDDNTWSALEYACHVRDVYRLYFYRLGLMLEQDDPLFPNWDQDATAVEERYELQDPAVVGQEIIDAAEPLAAGFDTVSGQQWTRPGRRSDGRDFTIESFGRYMLHDPVHHVHDVMAGYARLAAS